jgi:hypothetical protein
MAVSALQNRTSLDTAALPRVADAAKPGGTSGGSPMDLVCRRTVRESADGADSALGFDYRYVVSLPNPRHPQPAPAVIRHHCSDDITASTRSSRHVPNSFTRPSSSSSFAGCPRQAAW